LIKKYTILTCAFLLFACCSQIFAINSFGPASGVLTTAEPVGNGIGYLGGFAGFGDEATAVFGMLAYGFSDYTDGRVKFGFSDIDIPGSDPSILIGADFKYEIMNYDDTNAKNPLDLSAGAFFEYVAYENLGTLELGGRFYGSIPYRFKNGTKLVPYAVFNLRLESVSIDRSGLGDESESDFRVGFNIGTLYNFVEDMNMYGELQLDGNFGFYFGLEYRVF